MTGLPDRPADRSQRAVPATVASVVRTAGCSRLGADGGYNCSADEMTRTVESDQAAAECSHDGT
jgi:hypothetical protein